MASKVIVAAVCIALALAGQVQGGTDVEEQDPSDSGAFTALMVAGQILGSKNFEAHKQVVGETLKAIKKHDRCFFGVCFSTWDDLPEELYRRLEKNLKDFAASQAVLEKNRPYYLEKEIERLQMRHYCGLGMYKDQLICQALRRIKCENLRRGRENAC